MFVYRLRTDVQMNRCTGVQELYMCICVQMYMCISVHEVNRCTGIHVYMCAGVQVNIFIGVQVYK